jgi:phage tail sheath protein FI
MVMSDDNVNVERLQNIFEDSFKEFGNPIEESIWEPDMDYIKSQCKKIIDNYLECYTIQEFKVICDETNNSQEDIDNQKMNVDVFISRRMFESLDPEVQDILLENRVNND